MSSTLLPQQKYKPKIGTRRDPNLTRRGLIAARMRPALRGALIGALLPLILGAILVAAWYVLTLRDENNFVRSTPGEVAAAFADLVQSGELLTHIAATLAEIGIGLLLGVGSSFTIGNAIARSQALDVVVSPYIAGAQAIPIVAIAPILITFIGPSLITNGIICALIVFFPMLVATVVGLRTVDPVRRDLLRSYSASAWQTFTALELPSALPNLLGGLKVSATLAVVGAVVGEAISSEAGLGWLIYQSRYVYNTSRVLVGLFTLTAVAFTLYWIVSRIEVRLLRWRPRP